MDTKIWSPVQIGSGASTGTQSLTLNKLQGQKNRFQQEETLSRTKRSPTQVQQRGQRGQEKGFKVSSGLMRGLRLQPLRSGASADLLIT